MPLIEQNILLKGKLLISRNLSVTAITVVVPEVRIERIKRVETESLGGDLELRNRGRRKDLVISPKATGNIFHLLSAARTLQTRAQQPPNL